MIARKELKHGYIYFALLLFIQRPSGLHNSLAARSQKQMSTNFRYHTVLAGTRRAFSTASESASLIFSASQPICVR